MSNPCAPTRFPARLIEPDYDAPWHQRGQLLSPVARCETCAHWAREIGGACAITFDLGLVEVKNPEDRCASWSGHVDYEAQVARVQARYDSDSREMRLR